MVLPPELRIQIKNIMALYEMNRSKVHVSIISRLGKQPCKELCSEISICLGGNKFIPTGNPWVYGYFTKPGHPYKSLLVETASSWLKAGFHKLNAANGDEKSEHSGLLLFLNYQGSTMVNLVLCSLSWTLLPKSGLLLSSLDLHRECDFSCLRQEKVI